MFTREKGTEISRKKKLEICLGEILGPWIPPEGGKKKKKKKVPPKSVAMKEKERNEIYIYLYFFFKKNQKIRINMKPSDGKEL